MIIHSTFAGFTTGQLGMAASQKALDVTGQNIANINTTGYTRQRLDISSMNLKMTSGAINAGYGVEQRSISQLRDPFLDIQYRNQMSRLGTTDAQAAGLEQLENIFDETDTDGIRSALREINSALDRLSGEVGNKEFDGMVRSNMQNFVNLLHQSAASLKDIRKDAERSLETVDIVGVNQILQNIAELNSKIKNSSILGNPALELKDQRNALIDELASYLPIKVEYEDKPLGGSQSVEIMNIYFAGGDGSRQLLVSDGSYGSLDVEFDDGKAKLSMWDAKNGQQVPLTQENLTDGTLKGTLDFLNKEGDMDGSDFRGIGYYEKALDALVDRFAKVMNELNRPVMTDEDGNVIWEDETADPKVPKRVENGNPLFTTSDGSENFTAENIRIAQGWLNGDYGITASVKPDEDGKISSSANDNILNMLQAMKDSQDFGFYKGSFYDCYANIESTLGIDIKSAETTLNNQISVLNQTANAKDGVSGVQLDEEGMNLMHYQQSYSAAARYMTTLNELLDTLINQMGL